MSQTATASAGLTFPLTPGYNPQPLGASAPVPYTAIIPGEVLPLVANVSYSVDLAMMPAAGLAYLEIHVGKTDVNGATVTVPVKATFTNGFVWVMPGSFAVIVAGGAPPAGGITSLSLLTTATALATVTAAG